MAVSSRIQALLDQRRASSGYASSGKTRVLSPSSTSGISGIARQTLNAETSAKIDQYNNGTIGNDEMLSFLQKQSTNPILTPNERVSITSQIADFQDKIVGDKLQANYNQAPKNSLAQVQAAQSLADYHQARADKMVAGTPAQSQALQNAGVWKQNVTDLQTNLDKQARQNMRDQQMVQINSLPSGSSQQIQAKAELVKKLFDSANSQGDPEAATQYAAQYNQLTTQAQEAATREQTQAVTQSRKDQKTAITNQINTWLNDYHDNKLDANTLNQNLAQIAPYVDQTGDTALQLSFNRTLDSVQKDIQAGGLNRVEVGKGLWAVTGKGGGATTGYDESAYTYSKRIRVAQAALDAGVGPDGKPYDLKQYQEDVTFAAQQRFTDVQKQMADVQSIADQNPNAKVPFDGSRIKASNVLETLDKEQQSLQEQNNAVQNGRAVLVEVPPKKGAELGTGRASVTYQLQDSQTVDPNRFVKDEQGVYHPITTENLFIPASEITDAMRIAGIFTDTKGKYGPKYDSKHPELGGAYQFTPDASGNGVAKTGKQIVDVYNPATGEKYTTPYSSEVPVLSYGGSLKNSEQSNLEHAAYQTALDAKKTQVVQPQPQPKNNLVDTVGKFLSPIASNIGNELGNLVKTASPTIKPVQNNTPVLSTPPTNIPNIQPTWSQPKASPLGTQIYSQPSVSQSAQTSMPIKLPTIQPQQNFLQPIGNAIGSAVSSAGNFLGTTANNIGKGINDLATKLNLKFW